MVLILLGCWGKVFVFIICGFGVNLIFWGGIKIFFGYIKVVDCLIVLFVKFFFWVDKVFLFNIFLVVNFILFN